MKYPEQPETYDGYIAHLCTVESQIPERKRATKNDAAKIEGKNNADLGSRNSHGNSGARTRSNPGPRAAGKVRRGRNHEEKTNGGKDERNKGFKRKREEPLDASVNAQPDVTCFKCHNQGHYAHSCPENSSSDAARAKNY